MEMRQVLVIIGFFVAVSAAPLPSEWERKIYADVTRILNRDKLFRFPSAAGPVKISDNNIENIYNININIQGVFTNNIEQDIVGIIVGLLNNQGNGSSEADGVTLKDRLMALAEQSGAKDLNVDVPVGTLGKNINFDGLADKIKTAIAKKAAPENPEPANIEWTWYEVIKIYSACTIKLRDVIESDFDFIFLSHREATQKMLQNLFFLLTIDWVFVIETSYQ